MPDGSTRIYRWFDADGVLLYVGITSAVTRRAIEHMSQAVWAQWAVRMEVEDVIPESREEAEQMERERIATESPVFNKQGNRDWSIRQDQYLARKGVVPRQTRPMTEDELDAFIDDCVNTRGGGEDLQASFARGDLIWDLWERATDLGMTLDDLSRKMEVRASAIPSQDAESDDAVPLALLQRFAWAVGLRVRLKLVDLEEAWADDRAAWRRMQEMKDATPET